MNAPAIAQFSKELATQEKAFASVLPAHIPPKKFMRTIVSAVQNNPDILQCDRQSVMNACQRAAQDGLIIDGREAAIVQFKRTAQYMPMVSGILKKLRNSGQLASITAQIVYTSDRFAYNPGTGELDHQPDWFGNRGEPVGVYAMAILSDGSKQVEIMNQEQIEKVRQVSRAKDRGPWADWKEEMWKKTALRRLCKYLPSSADVDQMLEHDNANYELERDITPQAQAVDDINADLGLIQQQPPAPAKEPVMVVDTKTGEVEDII